MKEIEREDQNLNEPEATPAMTLEKAGPLPAEENAGRPAAAGVNGSTPAAEMGNEAQAAPDQAALTPELIEELEEKAAKADEYWERLVRVSADFDNYKKRSARERQESIKFANESLMEKLIPALDNFEMALAASTQPQGGSLESLKKGIQMIYSQLKSVLAEAGLEEIDATNQPFDPNWHEAVAQQESPDVPEGQVLQQMRRGYKLRDRLLRPASVVVAKKPAA